MEIGIYILMLGILLVCGLAISRACKAIKIPVVTGYLVVGLILAIVCIFVSEELASKLKQLNDIFASVALGFIALSIGEEFSLSKIKKFGSKIILITFLQALLAAILVVIGVVISTRVLGFDSNVSLCIGLCLGAIATATAPAATIMVINQYKAKGPLVDLLLPVVAFDDAIGLVVFSINVAISKSLATGASLSIASVALLPLIDILGSLLLGFILGLIAHIVVPYFHSRRNHAIVFITMTLIGVGTCAIFNNIDSIMPFGQHLELSNLLCCMMIGATYCNIVKKEKVDAMIRDFEQIDRWTTFLFMLFFVLSGCHLAISFKEIVNENQGNNVILPIAIIFIVYMVLRSMGKYFGSYIGCKITKRSKEITNNLGITLLPQAGVAIGMANSISHIEEFKTSSIGNLIVTVVLCATLVYELVGPILTKYSLLRVGEIPDENGIYPFETKHMIAQSVYFKGK